MGAVHLTVSELARSVDFWRDAVGLEVLEQGAARASLGSDGRELLALVEEPGARPADGFTGLFHVALLVPERPTSRPGSRTRDGTGSRCRASPTTSSARRSTSATPTGTGSRSTPTARASRGRGRSSG